MLSYLISQKLMKRVEPIINSSLLRIITIAKRYESNSERLKFISDIEFGWSAESNKEIHS